MMVDTSAMTPSEEWSDEFDPEEQVEIGALADEAVDLLHHQRWCRSVSRVYFDRGWLGALCVFYCETEADQARDPGVWVVVGDIPPAVFRAEGACRTGAAAVREYVREMREWIAALNSGEHPDTVSVVERLSLRTLPPTREFAVMLQKRLELIEALIFPELDTT